MVGMQGNWKGTGLRQQAKNNVKSKSLLPIIISTSRNIVTEQILY